MVRETPEDSKENDYTGTLTLKRDKRDKERGVDVKMEQLKKKLKTDDDLNWVDHSKTLREQGIDESETLILRRKFFFSDQNIDSRDPVQLNLLYVQTRDAIIAGTHPVTMEEACEFAGIQSQIQFGDYNENKHRAGLLDLKEFLPKDYAKTKGIEKRVFGCHMRHAGQTDLDAKVEYVRLARSLKTYGVTFFLVKEKMKGKNKLVPRLLGVTKDSVLRLDEKTKEILKTWPLTTVKRWAASPNSFTLDFGDYSDSYYSVQTAEGEQISQLIAGYIDIILKRKKAKDHFGIEGDEGSTMVEDSVAPYKATVLQHQTPQKPCLPTIGNVALPAVLRAATNGPKPVSTSVMPPVLLPAVTAYSHLGHAPEVSSRRLEVRSVESKPQRAILSTLDAAHDVIKKAEKDLDKKAEVPLLEADVDAKKQKVASDLAAMNAAAAQIITLSSVPEEEMDTPALEAAVSTITSHLPEMSKDVKIIASLMEDEDRSNKLIDAAKQLCKAFSDLLKAAEPGKAPKTGMLQAANKVGEASSSLLHTIGEEDEFDKETGDILLAIAKGVANAAASLVRKAKDVASVCDDEDLQRKVIGSAAECAMATNQLVTTAKVVAPTIQDPSCQNRLMDCCRELAKAVENMLKQCQLSVKDPRLIDDLKAAAAAVTAALKDLLNHIRSVEDHKAQRITEDEKAVDTILEASDKICKSTGDANEMIKQARILAQATSQLINDIKGQAGAQPNSEIAQRMFAAAKRLADATTRLVEAAKGCASHPHDSEYQSALKQAALDVRSATDTASSNALRKKLISRLESSAKNATNLANQNISVIHRSAPYNENYSLKEELNTIATEVSETIPSVVQGIKGVHKSPEDQEKQMQLVTTCENFLDPAQRMANLSKYAVPTISDQACSAQLSNTSQELSEALSDLRTNLVQCQDAFIPSVSSSIDTSIETIRTMIREVEEYKQEASRGQLRVLPGESQEICSTQLPNNCKSLGSAVAGLLTAASQGDASATNASARETTSALKSLTKSVRGLASTSNDPDFQIRVLNSAKEVLNKSLSLLEETKWAIANAHDPEIQARLTYVAKGVSNALTNCLNCMPAQRDVADAVRTVTESSQSFSSVTYQTSSSKALNELQNDLINSALRLQEAASDVVTNSRSPSTLSPSAKRFSHAFANLAKAGQDMVASTKDTNFKSQLLTSLKSISSYSNKLLVSAKEMSNDPDSVQAKNYLTTAARKLSDAINNLINICTSGITASIQNDIDAAIRSIQMMKPLLDDTLKPVNNSSYFECLDVVVDVSRKLGDAMTNIVTTCERGDYEAFSESVKESSESVCGLIENAAQASYLVGAADPTSVPGKQGLVDINAFYKADDAIQQACKQLASRNSTQQQILSAATVVAKHTSALCNSCRAASTKTNDPNARRYFVQSAKDVANATANLVKEIKMLDQDQSSERYRQNCVAATKPLLEAMENLVAFASSPQFASISAKISEKARLAQLPITSSGKLIIDHFCELLQTAKSLAVNAKDPAGWQDLAGHSRDVSDSIKKLVSSIKDATPGQKECDKAIEKLRSNIKDLDQASLNLITQNGYQGSRDSNLKTYREMIYSTVSAIEDKIEPVRVTAKSEAENIGHTVFALVSYFDPLVQNVIGAAAKSSNSKQQSALLDQTKTICECALQFILNVRESGGNPKATMTHSQIDESSYMLKEALRNLNQTIQSYSSEAGQVTTVIETLTKSISSMQERSYITSSHIDHSMSFVDYQTRMVSEVKEIARIAQEIITKSITDVDQMTSLAYKLASVYENLVQDTMGAVAVSSSEEIASRIKTSVHNLGVACVDLTKAAGDCQNNPGDTHCQREVSEQGKLVSEKASYVLAALQAGSRGTQACINAASTVSGIIADLNTTIMFASAGTLNPENENDVFANYRDNILKTAKTLVDDTKTLVTGAASSQEQLAVAAQNAVPTIVQLAEIVKLGAASLTSKNSEAQVMLLHAVKDVASSLGELIQATKSASGKNNNDPAMKHLREVAKVMITNVTSLLQTVKLVEDEHQRGTRALEATIEAIAQEIRAFDSNDPPSKKGTPEDLVRITKPVTLATAKAVAAGNSGQQEDVIVAANMGRKAIFDLLVSCKQAAWGAETPDLKQKVLAAGRNCAVSHRELLKMVHQCIQRPSGATHEEKQKLIEMSRNIAAAITNIVSCAEMLKGSDWVDPSDPTEIAETELLGAASSIDAAAKKLASLEPRRTSVKVNLINKIFKTIKLMKKMF